MRPLIAVGALTLPAKPAFAQRIDTRLVHVRETASSTMCDFKAFPITLIDGTKGGSGKVATWRAAPVEAKPDDLSR